MRKRTCCHCAFHDKRGIVEVQEDYDVANAAHGCSWTVLRIECEREFWAKPGTAADCRCATTDGYTACGEPGGCSDVASPDAIIAAAYDVISGPAGQKRDWNRMRSLFYPGARLIRTAPKKEGGIGATSFSPQDYIDRASIYLEKNGFSEKEIARGTEQWGNIL